jgi:hypothetical protein
MLDATTIRMICGVLAALLLVAIEMRRRARQEEAE